MNSNNVAFNYSVDSEDRVYDSKDNYFAVIENATDIKLKGKKPALFK